MVTTFCLSARALWDAFFVSGLAVALAGTGEPSPPHSTEDCIKVTSRASLLHLGSLDSFDITEGGTKAAELILDCLDHDRPASAQGALMIYSKIIPNENFGGEYSALQWICEYLVAPAAARKAMLADRHADSFYQFWAENNYAPLKEYLKRKYHLDKTPTREKDEAALRHRFHEDFILFNNPKREAWEQGGRIREALGLKKGDVVADIGSGPGYNTFKFAETVGDEGLVYAVDNNDRHRQYVASQAQKLGVRNVRTVQPSFGSANLPKDAKVDCVFMGSLYHIIYATFTEEEREGYLDSVKRCLGPGGKMVIVDNALVEDQTLPYHGPYIAKELVVQQLKRHGFTLTASHQFIPQRYMLVFKVSDGSAPPPGPRTACDRRDCVPINSPLSLLQCLKTATSPGFTQGGRKAARDFFRALDKHDASAARSALAQYRQLIPRERFGDEYTAFVWFCEYILAAPEGRKAALADPLVADYFRYLGGDDFTLLKKYVWNKYYLDTPDEDVDAGPGVVSRKPPSQVSQDDITAWGDFISFNNPRRPTWEKTGEVLDFLKIKPGDSVADVGSGPGFYTFKFSEIVGKSGRVFAVDTSQDMLTYVGATAARHGMSNVTPIKARLNDTKLPPDSVDTVYLCSLYHSVYVTSLEYVKDQFIDSIKKALKKGGRLIIVDNEPMRDAQNPYYGPRIDRRLTVLQLKHYGFRLVDSAQFVPQRDVLVFQRD